MKKLTFALFILFLSGMAHAYCPPDNGCAEPFIYKIPFMPPGSDWDHQGFVRITNLTGFTTNVDVAGYDANGDVSPGIAFFDLAPYATKSFRIIELEDGAAHKGLQGSIGYGQGDWQMRFVSVIPLQVNAFYRNRMSGFIGSLHDSSKPVVGTTHILPTVNPGSNPNQVGMIKLVNPSQDPVSIEIRGVDDNGVEWPTDSSVDPVIVSLEGHRSKTITTAELELGEPGEGYNVRNPLGDGYGKWRLYLTSDSEFTALSLIEAPGYYLSNVTSAGSDFEPTLGSDPLSCEDIDGAILMGQTQIPVYLGFFGHTSAVNSILNTSGPYGNGGSEGIMSGFAPFTSELPYSPWGQTSFMPPVILKDGKFIGYLTFNSNLSPRMESQVIFECSFVAGQRSPLNPDTP